MLKNEENNNEGNIDLKVKNQNLSKKTKSKIEMVTRGQHELP